MPETYTQEQIDKARETLKKCIEIEGRYETGPYRCKQPTLGGYVYVSKGVFTVPLTKERDVILSALSTAEQRLAQETERADRAEKDCNFRSSQICMISSELCGDGKIDPNNSFDPRWTPALDKARQLRARAEAAEKRCKELDAAILGLELAGNNMHFLNNAITGKAWAEACHVVDILNKDQTSDTQDKPHLEADYLNG